MILRYVLVGIITIAALPEAFADDPTGCPATSPASRPALTSRPAGQIARLIHLIDAAVSPFDAAAAYAQGNSIDDKNTDLRRAYMRRMLRFGLPQIAYHPAQFLTRLDPNDATAWGVISYVEAKDWKMISALEVGLRATLLSQTDPSILRNAGQLLSWYENAEPRPVVSEAVRQTIIDNREYLMGNGHFAKGFTLIEGEYVRLAEQKEQLEAKIQAAQQGVEEALADLKNTDMAIRDTKGNIELEEKSLKDLRRELNDVKAELYKEDLKNDSALERYYLRRLRDELRRQISEKKQAIENLEDELDKLHEKILYLKKLFVRRRRALKSMRREVELELKGLRPSFLWNPPAVDGVVTPEVESLDVVLKSRTHPAKTPQDDAARQLRLAQLYLTHDMNEKAGEFLREIIAKYGGTEAASRARELLRTLERKDTGDP